MKKILLISLFAFILSACASTRDMHTLGSNLKKVEIGMTKKEIVSILGKSYASVGAVQTPEGVVDVISYQDQYGQKYSFHFLKGELIEWYKDRPMPYHPHKNEPR